MEFRTNARYPIETHMHDPVALAEIDLYSEVLTAVATAEHRLSLTEIDRILGVRPVRPVRSGLEGPITATRPSPAPPSARRPAVSEREFPARRG